MIASIPDVLLWEHLVLLGLMIVGYIPVLLAYHRNGSRWVLAGYTTVLVGLLGFVGSLIYELAVPGVLLHLFAFTLSGLFFLVAAYRSRQKIYEIDEQLEREGLVMLDE